MYCAIRDEDSLQARSHFTMAEVDGIRYDLYDDAHVLVSFVVLRLGICCSIIAVKQTDIFLYCFS